MVKVDNAKKYYYSIVRGVVKAVDDVTFEVKEREIFGLVGLQRGGKTTVSRMIAGLPATGGSVMVRIGNALGTTCPMGEGPRPRPLRRPFHQEYSLYPFNTVLQNLTVCIGMKMPAEFAKIKAIRCWQRSDSPPGSPSDHIRHAGNLSVGEKQRVALAQVLIHEPRIVILDDQPPWTQ